MVELTLFEIHLDGAEFTANAPFSDTTAEEAEDGSGIELGGESGPEESAPGIGKTVLVALALAVVVVVIKRMLGGDADGEE